MRHYHVDSMTYTAPLPRHKLGLQIGMVTLQQRGRNSFAVRYGREVHEGLSYADACTKLGEALMHQAVCDGAIRGD